CTGDQWSCTDAEGTDNTVRMGIFNYYRDNDEYAKKYFWTPSVTVTGGVDMPTVGEVRGKIVLRSFDGTLGGWFGYGLKQVQENENPATYIQDEYEVPTVFDIPAKWDKVKARLAATNADPNQNNMYVNFTSGSGGAFPYTVAGGTHFGDTDVDGVNYYCIEYLLGANVGRTGVVMMDFPGGGLIDAIIAHNY